jgi:hypothetical protein
MVVDGIDIELETGKEYLEFTETLEIERNYAGIKIKQQPGDRKEFKNSKLKY